MNAILAVFGLGGGELILVLGAVLILFGAKKIPEFAKGLGQGMKEFKKASREVTEELENAIHSDPTPPPPPAPKRVTDMTPPRTVATDVESTTTPLSKS